MSLEQEKMLLESKINGLRKKVEIKKIEGEMFVEQLRKITSPYQEFEEIDMDKARVTFNQLDETFKELQSLSKEVSKLEKRL